MQNNYDEKPWWRRRGVPGAGWVVAILVVFEVVVLAEWGWAAGHSAGAASASSHHMSGAGNK